MEKTLYLNWTLKEEQNKEEIRYCHNCGKKVTFTDSQIRRQNANGKNIYHYAIYKCPKGHTWNKKLNVFKTYDGLENTPDQKKKAVKKIKEITITQLVEEGYTHVQIQLSVTEKIRLDKVLAKHISDLSRTKIKEYIVKGNLYINGVQINKNVFVNGMLTVLFKCC